MTQRSMHAVPAHPRLHAFPCVAGRPIVAVAEKVIGFVGADIADARSSGLRGSSRQRGVSTMPRGRCIRDCVAIVGEEGFAAQAIVVARGMVEARTWRLAGSTGRCPRFHPALAVLAATPDPPTPWLDDAQNIISRVNWISEKSLRNTMSLLVYTPTCGRPTTPISGLMRAVMASPINTADERSGTRNSR